MFEKAQPSFRRVYSLLSQPWIYDFLFPSHPQIDQLHAALGSLNYLNAPLTAEVVVNRLSDGSQRADDEQLGQHVRMLFIPSFTTGGTTLGFQISELVNPVKRKCKFHHACTLRDDDNGILLKISRHHGQHVVEFSYAIQITSGTREHVQMFFYAEAFREAVRKRVAHDSEDIRKALAFCLYSFELSVCTVCSMEGVFCKCSILTRRKLHPLDYDTEIYNMKSYFGNFDYAANACTFTKGSVRTRSKVCGKSSSALTHDQLSQKQLSQWAMFNASGFCPINLRTLTLAEDVPKGKLKHHQPLSLQMTGTCKNNRREDNEDFSRKASETQLADVNILDEIVGWDEDVCSQMLSASSESDHADVGCAVDQNRRRDWFNDADIAEISGMFALKKDVTMGDATKRKSGEQHSTGANSGDKTAITAANVAPASSFTNTTTSTSCNNRAPCTPQVERTLGSTITTSMTAQAIVQSTGALKGRLCAIAPAGGHGDEVIRRQHERYELEAKQRMEMRKERNRVSAHISNQKKKKRLEKLKVDIEEAMKKEASLRKKERALRAENLALRKSIGMAGKA